MNERLKIDGEGTGGITITVPEPVPWKGVNGVRIELSDPNANAARN